MTAALDPAVPRKLGLRAGAEVLVIEGPAGYAEALQAVAPEAHVAVAPRIGVFDQVQLFCRDRATLEAHAAEALAAYKPMGHLWVCYPKGGSGVATDLNRDVDWGPLAAAGFRAVTQVAIDRVWSALRFRPLTEVGR